MGTAEKAHALMRTLLVVCVLFLIAGCGGPKTPPQSFEIDGTKVEFSPPPPEWKLRKVEDGKKVQAVAFDHPGGQGHLAVTVTSGVKELTKDMLNDIALAVTKRKGRIVKDKYISVAGDKENAYRMEFETDEGKSRGLQVHFPQNGKLYSIVMTVPAGEFGSASKIFDNLVESFKTPGK